ncbi:MAG: sulfite exporter TauE/SafE family protein [Thiotrichales bacterium]
MAGFLPDAADLAWLLAAAFLAGLFDAAVGGGGLIQVPALFAVLPQVPPAALLGTNKLASIFGTLSAVAHYARSLRFDWRFLRIAAPVALLGALAGASVVAWLPVAWVRPLVLLLLIVILVRTWRDRQRGLSATPVRARPQVVAVAAGGGIGFYDGFFGPGTGSFLIFVFVRWLGQDFLHASAHAKVVNASTNLGALIYFAATGHVLWLLGFAMTAFNIAGAQVGTRIALKGGAALVRQLFFLLCIALILRLGWSLAVEWSGQ